MMKTLYIGAGLVAIGFASAAAQEAPPTVQPGAPGEETRVLESGEMSEMDFPEYNEADVRFMQGMIPHHQQALHMAALVDDRTGNESLHRLAQRIDISQKDEIAMMTRWLESRGQSVAAMADHHGGHGEMGLMPGMLTPAQMDELSDARGGEFDRLFLEYMIGHHEGALIMVRELFATPGGGQESSVHRYVADVDADQQMEIRRMQQMLNAGL